MTSYTDRAWENAKRKLEESFRGRLIEIDIKLFGQPGVGKSTFTDMLSSYLHEKGFLTLIRNNHAIMTEVLYGVREGITTHPINQPEQQNEVFDHPRFIGLWTYRPKGKQKQFCSSVMVDGEVQETSMYDDWEDALVEASEILEGTCEES